MQVDKLFWRLVLRLIAPASIVVAHYPGRIALRGRIAWEPQLGARPHRIAVTDTGHVLLIDLISTAERARAIAQWCEVHSTAEGWTFRHVTVIASTAARWYR